MYNKKLSIVFADFTVFPVSTRLTNGSLNIESVSFQWNHVELLMYMKITAHT